MIRLEKGRGKKKFFVFLGWSVSNNVHSNFTIIPVKNLELKIGNPFCFYFSLNVEFHTDVLRSLILLAQGISSKFHPLQTMRICVFTKYFIQLIIHFGSCEKRENMMKKKENFGDFVKILWRVRKFWNNDVVIIHTTSLFSTWGCTMMCDVCDKIY
jgi:hypothetical protein